MFCRGEGILLSGPTMEKARKALGKERPAKYITKKYGKSNLDESAIRKGKPL